MITCKILFGCIIFRIANGLVYIVMRTSVKNIGVRCKIMNRVRDLRISLFTITPERYVMTNRDKSF